MERKRNEKHHGFVIVWLTRKTKRIRLSGRRFNHPNSFLHSVVINNYSTPTFYWHFCTGFSMNKKSHGKLWSQTT